MWCKGGIKECSTRWERWNHSWANALHVIHHHRSKLQPGSLWALPLGNTHWLWGLAVWSPQPTASCKVWNAQWGHCKCLWDTDLRVLSRIRIGKNPTSSGFTTATFTAPTHRSAVCAWPQAFNSLNKLYETSSPEISIMSWVLDTKPFLSPP